MYVPCIPPDMMLDGKRFSTIEDVTDFFENKLCIGKVKRVDLITKPRGHTNILAAFVHFDCWYHTSEDMRKFMMGDGNGQCNIHGYFKRTNEDDRGEHRNFYSSQNRSFGRYLTCKINTNPIPEIAPMLASELNIHQLVHALEVARETIAENEKRLEEQARRIAELEQEVVNLREQTRLLNGRLDLFLNERIDLLRSAIRNPYAAAPVRSEGEPVFTKAEVADAAEQKRIKHREYQRAYYNRQKAKAKQNEYQRAYRARKKAEKAAAQAIGGTA